MPVTTHTKDGILTIAIGDERLTDVLQIKNLQQQLHELLEKSTEQLVIVDFHDVKFMASSALGTLIQLNKKCKEFKIKLKLSGICPEIFEVFKITKLHKVFDIEKDEPAARKAFLRKGIFG